MHLNTHLLLPFTHTKCLGCYEVISLARVIRKKKKKRTQKKTQKCVISYFFANASEFILEIFAFFLNLFDKITIMTIYINGKLYVYVRITSEEIKGQDCILIFH